VGEGGEGEWCEDELSLIGPTNPWGGFMVSKALLAGTATALCLASNTSLAQDWVLIKSAKELTALYSNKTLKGNGWIAHYRADGRGIQIIQNGKPVPRTWKVVGNDQICATVDNGTTNCFRYQRHQQNRNEIIITNVKDGMTFNATVQDGIPNF
jgi:hypothetical protein